MTAARAFCVIGMDDTVTPNRRNRILNKSCFVDGVRVNGYLHIVFIGGLQAEINGSRCRSPIFMEL